MKHFLLTYGLSFPTGTTEYSDYWRQ